jgi:hypothetical protein
MNSWWARPILVQCDLPIGSSRMTALTLLLSQFDKRWRVTPPSTQPTIERAARPTAETA